MSSEKKFLCVFMYKIVVEISKNKCKAVRLKQLIITTKKKMW